MSTNPRDGVTTRATRLVTRYLHGDGEPTPQGAWPGDDPRHPAARRYVCVVRRIRDSGFWAWALGQKVVDQFETALDPLDPYTLEEALKAAARRDHGGTSLFQYELTVLGLDGAVVVDCYRHQPAYDWPEG